MTYDDRGRKLTETNQMSQTRTFEYDLMGRLKSVTLPQLAGSTEAAKYLYSYDAEGRQTSLIDPLGRETTWEFDSQGRQVGRTLPLGAGWTERMEYDDLGRQKLAVSFEGVVTEYVYDTYGRMSGQRFFASMAAYNNGAGTPTETWAYTFDAFGRQLSVVRSSTTEATKTTSYTYNAEGQTSQVTSPEGTISYTYDVYGRKTSTIVGTLANPQRTTTYDYDSLGRLKTVTESTLQTKYQYDLIGNLDRVDLPNGTVEDYVYDSMNRLDKLVEYAPDGTPNDLSNNPKIAEYDYTVRADGRRTGLAEKFWTAGGVLQNEYTWDFDALNRLMSEKVDSTNNALDQTTSFTFDLTGNRLSKALDLGNDNVLDEVISYTYDANDRLLRETLDKTGTVGDTTTFYGYTGTQQSAKSVFSGLHASEPLAISQSLSATSFSYDLQGRMSVVTVTTRNSNGVATRNERTSYDYDSMGIRNSSKHEIDANADGAYESSTTTEFLTDHQNFTGYAQTVRETTKNATGHTTKTVDYTFGHDEISQTTKTYDANGSVTSEATLVFGHDGHGSVCVLTDLAGAIAQLFMFDAYGQMLAILNGAGALVSGGNGQLADATQALTSLLYSGESFDANINQQYLRARWRGVQKALHGFCEAKN